jgi:hypothetical protein
MTAQGGVRRVGTSTEEGRLVDLVPELPDAHRARRAQEHPARGTFSLTGAIGR